MGQMAKEVSDEVVHLFSPSDGMTRSLRQSQFVSVGFQISFTTVRLRTARHSTPESFRKSKTFHADSQPIRPVKPKLEVFTIRDTRSGSLEVKHYYTELKHSDPPGPGLHC
ncbi:MAG: hypothetical protein CM1200mP20_09450 [Pseudomonadota bacterium]|nr:MAG: hypothetical protein CM1200mP20_09450 [Pseudomonadota bacterium]